MAQGVPITSMGNCTMKRETGLGLGMTPAFAYSDAEVRLENLDRIDHRKEISEYWIGNGFLSFLLLSFWVYGRFVIFWD
jgi:hypothetical protein